MGRSPPAAGHHIIPILGFSMPSRIRLLAATTGLVVLLSGAAAGATCLAPTAPGTFPDGTTATLEEMKAGAAAVKEFIAQSDVYIDCLNSEAPKVDPKKSLSDKEKADLSAQLAAARKKVDIAEDDKKSVGAKMNEQIRAFKAKQAAAAPAQN